MPEFVSQHIVPLVAGSDRTMTYFVGPDWLRQIVDSPWLDLFFVAAALIFLWRIGSRAANSTDAATKRDAIERRRAMRPLQQLVSCNLETQKLLAAKERLLEAQRDIRRYSERIEQMRASDVQIWPVPHLDTLNQDAERLAGKITGVRELLGHADAADLRLPMPITDNVQQERFEGHPEIAARFDPKANGPYFNNHEANAKGWAVLLRGMIGQIERGLGQAREREKEILKEYADAARAQIRRADK